MDTSKTIDKQNNKSLSEQILSKHEIDVCNIIKLFETDIYSIFTNIFIFLKDNENIYHIDNYIPYNYIDKYIENHIPTMLLLGGSAYKIYSIFYNYYFKKNIIEFDKFLIESIDYDFSIIVKNTFNNNIFKDIIENICKNIAINIENINNCIYLQNFVDNDIKNDIFLNKKKIIKIKKFNKILLTYDTGKDYYSFQISIKYNNKIYQIIELLFWRNGIISNSIYIKDLEINQCILFQTDKFKILLPDISILLKTNIISMKSRLQSYDFYKCTKDFYRLKFIELINNITTNDNILEINDPIIKSSMIKINNIYKKENPTIFKLPFTICSLNNNNDDKNKIYELYNQFLNLNLNQQIDILINNKYINVVDKNIYNNIFN